MGYYNDKIKELYEKEKGSNSELEKEILKLYEFQKSYRNGIGDVINGLVIMDNKKDKIIKLAKNRGLI